MPGVGVVYVLGVGVVYVPGVGVCARCECMCWV